MTATLGSPVPYVTGGLGYGTGIDPLQSQGSLVLSRDHRWLLAVNAGSDQVSVFRVGPKGLTLTDLVDSGGVFPVSIAVYRDLVYVLNTGGGQGDADMIRGSPSVSAALSARWPAQPGLSARTLPTRPRWASRRTVPS